MTKPAKYWTEGTIGPLWPRPEDPMPEEIVVTEGEFDAIVLRHARVNLGVEEIPLAYSVSMGAGTSFTPYFWEWMGRAGVRRVLVCFDEDAAGRKGRDSMLAQLREAGIEALAVRPRGLDPSLGEKDARDVALRLGHPVMLDAITDESEPQALSVIDLASERDLVLGRLHPTEHTVLYGDGSVGKGVLAAWWVARLVEEESRRVLIVDYEQHARHEWRPRVEAFMSDPARLDDVILVQPQRPLWDVADWLRDAARRVRADFVVVDSAAYACVGSRVEDSETAIRYSMAQATLQLPVLTIAHTTKTDPESQTHPFGSTYWHNGARVTMSLTRTGEDDTDPRLLRCWKTNQRARFVPVEIEWDWVDTGLPAGLAERAARGTVKSLQGAYEELMRALGQAPTQAELEQYVGEEVKPGTFRAISRRAPVIVTRS